MGELRELKKNLYRLAVLLRGGYWGDGRYTINITLHFSEGEDSIAVDVDDLGGTYKRGLGFVLDIQSVRKLCEAVRVADVDERSAGRFWIDVENILTAEIERG